MFMVEMQSPEVAFGALVSTGRSPACKTQLCLCSPMPQTSEAEGGHNWRSTDSGTHPHVPCYTEALAAVKEECLTATLLTEA